MRPSVSPSFWRGSCEESQPRRIICPERFSRFLLSSLSVFLSWPRHHLLIHRRLYTRHPFFILYPSLTLFALREIRSWKDPIRPDTTETSTGSQLRDYPADPFRLDAVLQIPFPTGCAAYLSIEPTTFRSDDQKRSGNPTRPANVTRTVIFRGEVVIFRASDTMKLDFFNIIFWLYCSQHKNNHNNKLKELQRYIIYENPRNLKIHFN